MANTQTQVLVVEDDETFASLIGAYLRSDGRFRVHHAGTLHDACATNTDDSPNVDLIVLDLNLPDSTGLATFETLRGVYPVIPFVVLSGNDDEELAIEAVSLGAQDYVQKATLEQALLVRSLLYALERNHRLLYERKSLEFEKELRTARQIQQHMLPSELPQPEGFEITAICQASSMCSGDFFDVIPRKNGFFDFVVADVSSHGLGPALIMVGTRRMLRTCGQIYDDVGQVFTILNQAVFEDTLRAQFVTMFLARLHPESGTLSYLGAGHESYLLYADGLVNFLDSNNVPLGIVEDRLYEMTQSVKLNPGDLVLLATDGTWEVTNPEGQQLGRGTLFELIQQHRHKPVREIVQIVLDHIREFRARPDFEDDVTIMLIKAL